MGVHPEDKLDAHFIPAIQFAREGKVGISAQGDLASVGFDHLNSTVDPPRAILVADRIARTVEQIEHLVGVGHRDNQRGVSPDAFIGEGHPAFALAQRGGDRPIDINKGFLEKIRLLLTPHPLAHAVDHLH